MGFPINFPQHRKMKQNLSNWKSLENWYPYFPQSMSTFLPLDSYPMVYFTTWEMHDCSHQFPIAQGTAVKSTEWCCFSTALLFLLVPKSDDSLKERKEKSDKVNSILKKSIPDTLELKAKYIKRRRRHGCNSIKREKYKYILGKSIPSYTKMFLFSTIGSKNRKVS